MQETRSFAEASKKRGQLGFTSKQEEPHTHKIDRSSSQANGEDCGEKITTSTVRNHDLKEGGSEG
jgi:hypothetical protein